MHHWPAIEEEGGRGKKRLSKLHKHEPNRDGHIRCVNQCIRVKHGPLMVKVTFQKREMLLLLLVSMMMMMMMLVMMMMWKCKAQMLHRYTVVRKSGFP